ncbi:hypothetical protein BHE74_00040863 [Ensete ventricosum]|nr:hypothetical protein BHE74_00040863 [Ensete ventricosum]
MYSHCCHQQAAPSTMRRARARVDGRVCVLQKRVTATRTRWQHRLLLLPRDQLDRLVLEQRMTAAEKAELPGTSPPSSAVNHAWRRCRWELEITTPFAFNRRDPPVEMSTESSIGSSFPRINSTPRHDDHRGDVDDEKKRPADHDSGPGVEGVQPHSQVHCIHQHLCLHGSRLQMDENQFSTGHFLDL